MNELAVAGKEGRILKEDTCTTANTFIGTIFKSNCIHKAIAISNTVDPNKEKNTHQHMKKISSVYKFYYTFLA